MVVENVKTGEKTGDVADEREDGTLAFSGLQATRPNWAVRLDILEPRSAINTDENMKTNIPAVCRRRYPCEAARQVSHGCRRYAIAAIMAENTWNIKCCQRAKPI